jgi:hypothetical protein
MSISSLVGFLMISRPRKLICPLFSYNGLSCRFGCILFDVENISFDAGLVIYINSTNIPPIMIINGIYEHQNLLSL